MPFTAAEKAAEAEREIVMRLRVYGRKVQEGRMSAKTADRLIGIMKEIRDDYLTLAQKDRLI